MSDGCVPYPEGMEIDPEGIWYHGSNLSFSLLREGSTVTQWRELAEAFSHKPSILSCGDGPDSAGKEGQSGGKEKILHNGREAGWLYQIDEEVVPGRDLYPHPGTTMAPNLEFLTTRPLRLRLIGPVAAPSPEEAAASEERLVHLIRIHKKQ